MGSPLRHPRLMGVLAAAIAVIAYLLLLSQPVWNTNDDVIMSMMAAGVWFSPRPSADMAFVHPFIGHPISRLHLWRPDFPWYALFLCACIALSLALLCCSVLRLRSRPGFLAILIYAATATALPAFAYLQFTTVAGLVTASGTMLLLSLLLRPPTTRSLGIVGILLALSMLSLGSMIRFDSAVLVALVSWPCGIVLVLRSARGARQAGISLRPVLAGIVTVAVLAGIALGTPEASRRWLYRGSAQWSRWFCLQRGRSGLKTYRNVTYDPRVFASVGWSRTDRDMIRKWLDVDPSQHSAKRMAAVVEACRMGVTERLLQFDRWRTGLRRMLGQIRRNPSHCSRGLWLCMLVTIVGVISWQGWEILGGAAIACASIPTILYLHVVLGHAPYRVHATLWMSVFWLLLLIAAMSEGLSVFTYLARQSRASRVAGVTLAAAALVLALHADFVCGRRRVERAAADHGRLVRRIQTWAAGLPSGSIVCSAGTAFPYEHHLPLKSFHYMRSLKGFIGLGWPNQTPQLSEVIGRLGLDRDFWQSLARRRHVFWVRGPFSKGPGHVLQRYYREKHGAELSFIEEPGMPFLYRMVFGEPAVSQGSAQ